MSIVNPSLPDWFVRFFEEKNIVRRFRKEDEPAVCARDMSEEEVTAY